MERCRDHRGESDGSYTSSSLNSSKNEHLKFYGLSNGKSALIIFERHANLKYKFGNRHFWSRGCYVSRVGLNEATIAKYVREQEKHDQMIDRTNTKEVEDPYRG